MDLFSATAQPNILPYDGDVRYYGKILGTEKAQYYLEKLLQQVEWKNDEAVIFGKHIVTKRKAAWYGDSAYAYTYSNTTKHALPWTKDLLALKSLIEEQVGSKFNSCLLNLYHSGEEGMAWHSDDEKALGKHTTIASLSLGADRKFSFKHKSSSQTLSLILERGSLLVMQGTTQSHWLHSLPKSRKVKAPRINLTFRTIIE
ncbi:MAG: alpha-ketoglutarate-dependent dioxygenase AlkB [Reichenbachiella sp.]|uniref:alpha-ketoglutarate-dependent dioxygenase AlkB family protein n=1 Tax=Reichenbachiella sp. TaxID=2184521 RepID=UPI0032671D94